MESKERFVDMVVVEDNKEEEQEEEERYTYSYSSQDFPVHFDSFNTSEVR